MMSFTFLHWRVFRKIGRVGMLEGLKEGHRGSSEILRLSSCGWVGGRGVGVGGGVYMRAL